MLLFISFVPGEGLGGEHILVHIFQIQKLLFSPLSLSPLCPSASQSLSLSVPVSLRLSRSPFSPTYSLAAAAAGITGQPSGHASAQRVGTGRARRPCGQSAMNVELERSLTSWPT